MQQIDGKLYDMIYKLMQKKPAYVENDTTVLLDATYKAHYLIVDNNWYEISNTFLNIFLNLYLISPNGNQNRDYSTYIPNKQVLDVCHMCLNQIKTHKEETKSIVKPVKREKKVVLQKPKTIRTVVKNTITNEITVKNI